MDANEPKTAEDQLTHDLEKATVSMVRRNIMGGIAALAACLGMVYLALITWDEKKFFSGLFFALSVYMSVHAFKLLNLSLQLRNEVRQEQKKFGTML